MQRSAVAQAPWHSHSNRPTCRPQPQVGRGNVHAQCPQWVFWSVVSLPRAGKDASVSSVRAACKLPLCPVTALPIKAWCVCVRVCVRGCVYVCACGCVCEGLRVRVCACVCHPNRPCHDIAAKAGVCVCHQNSVICLGPWKAGIPALVCHRDCGASAAKAVVCLLSRLPRLWCVRCRGCGASAAKRLCGAQGLLVLWGYNVHSASPGPYMRTCVHMCLHVLGLPSSQKLELRNQEAKLIPTQLAAAMPTSRLPAIEPDLPAV